MSLIDIIIISIGGICVVVYGFFAIRKTLKWRERVRELVNQGKTLTQAKYIANTEFYKKKKGKEKGEQEKVDKIFDK